MNAAIQIDVTEKALQQMTQAQAEYNRAAALVVSSEPEYEAAGEYIAGLKRYKNALEKERKELVDPLNQHVKTINNKFKPHSDAIDKAIAQVNAKMVGYFRGQERIRLEAEAQAAEKARKEQERLQKRAEAAAAKGQEEKAAALQAQAEIVTPVAVQPTVHKQTGATTIAVTWSVQVYDKLALIEAVAAGKASMELLEPNMTALNQMARANKDTLNIPGVKAVADQNIRIK